jgi:cytoskeleton protein RodZ
VFEIGTTLREARVRRKLTLQQVEEDTKIRVKYLQAMENEDFDLMPGPRTSRASCAPTRPISGSTRASCSTSTPRGSAHTATHEPFGGSSALRPRVHRRRNTLLFVALVCLLILGVLYALGLGREAVEEAPPTRPDVLGITSPSPSPGDDVTASPSPSPTATRTPVPPDRFKLTTTKGDCWLQVRRGGEGGPVVFEGTVEQGRTRVWRAPLWLRIGSPPSIGMRLGGKKLPPIDEAGPVDVLIKDGEMTVLR